MRRRLLLLFCLLLGCASAWAQEPRFAFVVSSRMPGPEFGHLRYVHAGGELVENTLRLLGFEVSSQQNPTREEFEAGFRAFVDRVAKAETPPVAFLYFAGHVKAEAGKNHVVLGGQRHFGSELLADGSVPVSELSSAIGSLRTRASFVVIDSDLDAPESFFSSPGRGAGGMIFASHGRPGRRSIGFNHFAVELAGALLYPGANASAAFKQVQVKMAERTNGRVVPWVDDGLVRNLRLAPSTGLRIDGTQLKPSSLLDQALWLALADEKDPDLMRYYLRYFPEGKFSGLARLRMEYAGSSAAPATDSPARQKRVALTIGNSAYERVGTLINPARDASAMAGALRELGFSEVFEHRDLGRSGLLDALRRFAASAMDADWAVIYYAGHGIEMDGANFMVPVDAKLASREDAPDELIAVSRLFERLEGMKGIKIVILDACRNNPLPSRARSGRSGGLAAMPATPGTLIALAADPGKEASDGEGTHSPYAEALLKHIREPGIDVRLMFGKVYDTMRDRTKGAQEPWIQAKLSGQQQYRFRQDAQ